MTTPPTPDPAAQVVQIEAEFPGWQAWESLDRRWHARIRGAVPPVMVHADSPDGLRELLREQTGP